MTCFLTYLSKVGTPGTLEYREIFLIYREIFAKSDFFENFWSQIQKVRDIAMPEVKVCIFLVVRGRKAS